ncbi:MAG: hypothetical protein CM15mP128_1360 [Methanobacteriota archaeon]|nr:MAG: hypothetical protein CM15mP128_1360 [Euryarchaeota archaeon]
MPLSAPGFPSAIFTARVVWSGDNPGVPRANPDITLGFIDANPPSFQPSASSSTSKGRILRATRGNPPRALNDTFWSEAPSPSCRPARGSDAQQTRSSGISCPFPNKVRGLARRGDGRRCAGLQRAGLGQRKPSCWSTPFPVSKTTSSCFGFFRGHASVNRAPVRRRGTRLKGRPLAFTGRVVWLNIAAPRDLWDPGRCVRRGENVVRRFLTRTAATRVGAAFVGPRSQTSPTRTCVSITNIPGRGEA